MFDRGGRGRGGVLTSGAPIGSEAFVVRCPQQHDVLWLAITVLTSGLAQREFTTLLCGSAARSAEKSVHEG